MLISINCPNIDYEVKYTDRHTGEECILKMGAKNWDLSTWLDNGSEEGIEQRAHEEELMLDNEVIGKEGDYGISWDYFFNNSQILTGNNEEEKKSLLSLLQQQITAALYQIENVIEVVNVYINPKPVDKKIKIYAGIIYKDNKNETNNVVVEGEISV